MALVEDICLDGIELLYRGGIDMLNDTVNKEHKVEDSLISKVEKMEATDGVEVCCSLT